MTSFDDEQVDREVKKLLSEQSEQSLRKTLKKVNREAVQALRIQLCCRTEELSDRERLLRLDLIRVSAALVGLTSRPFVTLPNKRLRDIADLLTTMIPEERNEVAGKTGAKAAAKKRAGKKSRKGD